MKITGPFGVGGVSSSRRKPKKDGGGFAQMLEDAQDSKDSPVAAESVEAAPALPGFLALQEMSDEEVARRKAITRGRKALDLLAQLQRELLVATPRPSTLREMQHSLDAMGKEVPPQVQEVIREVRLRVAVELAKWEA